MKLPEPEPTEVQADLTPEPTAGAFVGHEAEADQGPPAEKVEQGSLGEPAQPDVLTAGRPCMGSPEACSDEAFAPTEAQDKPVLSPEQTSSIAATMDDTRGALGEDFYQQEENGGLAPPEDVEQRPSLPLPPQANAYSSSPFGPPAYPGGKGPGDGPNLPASFQHIPLFGDDVHGLFTEQPVQDDLYWQDWFTLPVDKGAGYDDWKEMGRCRYQPDSLVPVPIIDMEGSGVPRVAVLPNPKDSTKYDLHMYSWQGPKLRHFIAETPLKGNELIWQEKPPAQFHRGGSPIFTKDFFDTSKFLNPSKVKLNDPDYEFWAADMAVVYYWVGPVLVGPTPHPRVPELRFYFWPECGAGLPKAPLQCATTRDGEKFYTSSVTFPPAFGDNGWVTVPQAIHMPYNEWWMYYVGNTPQNEYAKANSNRPPPVTPHSTRIQFSTDNGVNWKPKVPSGLFAYPTNPPQDPLSTYNPLWGLYNTRVDPEVVYLKNTPWTDRSKPPPPKYRMYVKGRYNFEVTESTDGLNWGPLGLLNIGKHEPAAWDSGNWHDGYISRTTGKKIPPNYTGCYDMSVFRIPSENYTCMLYIKNDAIHYARLK